VWVQENGMGENSRYHTIRRGPVSEGDGVTEERYISQAERARRLIDKGTAAWQRVQAYAMANDEQIDSVVLRGQELWLPHHETDGRRFGVTLVVSLHVPAADEEAVRSLVSAFLQALEKELSDDHGTLSIRVETGEKEAGVSSASAPGRSG